MKRRRFRRAPLAIAGVAATALWFASLMAASLLLEKPGVVEWRNGQGELRVIYHPPSDENELKIWLASLIVPGIVLGIGFLASFVRFGVYIVSAATIVVGLALISRLDRWEALHTARFPAGSTCSARRAPATCSTRASGRRARRRRPSSSRGARSASAWPRS